jgi:hypothetical protein
LLVAAALTVAVGLTTHFLGTGPLAGIAGDALYAAMVFLVIAFVFPRASVLVVALSALGVCALIELFQLTGLPAVWGETFWPIRLVLGAGFDAVDLIAYAAGAGLAAACDLALTRRARASRRV